MQILTSAVPEESTQEPQQPIRLLQVVKESPENAMKVLIIDDDEAVALYLSQYFSKKGVYSKYFQAPLEALEYLKQVKKNSENGECFYGLVIADFRMPKMDGLSLSKKIKEIFPNLPILMVSAYASIDLAMRAGQSGIVDIIEKPISLAKVDEVLETLRPR